MPVGLKPPKATPRLPGPKIPGARTARNSGGLECPSTRSGGAVHPGGIPCGSVKRYRGDARGNATRQLLVALLNIKCCDVIRYRGTGAIALCHETA